MPTYEYACSSCNHQWDQIQRITEPPLEVCPKCSSPSAHRLISGGTNFILKGGGWYSDLYASPKSKAKSAENGKESPSTEAGSSSTGASSTDGQAKKGNSGSADAQATGGSSGSKATTPSAGPTPATGSA